MWSLFRTRPGRNAADGARRPSVPAGERVYAVGDIHGRADLLDALHQTILTDAGAAGEPARTIVYLGDYVDRGPDSRKVLDILIHGPLPGFQAIHLMGNHEDMMLRFLDGPATPLWLVNGGDATARSYGVTLPASASGPDAIEAIRAGLDVALPDGHRRFLENLRPFHIAGDYLFVHAGIRPGVPLDDQSPAELMWIRDRFLSSEDDHGYVVVHGHTITEHPEVRTNRIGIDTGAFFTDQLTCLVLTGAGRSFLTT